MDLQAYFGQTWKHYCTITPDAQRVHDLLKNAGETLINDHVAYRTFNLPGIDRLTVGKLFEAQGYQRKDDMNFAEKKLTATYWLHENSELPKVFISELRVEDVSPALKEWIRNLTKSALSKSPLTLESLLDASWPTPSFADYQKFYPESEYAAWTAVFGIRANHFTVLVNSLKNLTSVAAVNELLLNSGFKMNNSGGLIKGSPQEKLEQSSTLAQRIRYSFSDGEHEIPSCYYEFAKRFPVSEGGPLFQGFVPKSADKIFESTRSV